jgi:hypothetical protein
MRRSRTAAAAAAAVALFSVLAVHAHLEFGSYKTTQLELEVVSLLVVGDWGGQSADPYTTPGQLAAAAAMATVATASASTFVLSSGGNFYGDGIQGAPLGEGTRAHMPRPKKGGSGARGGVRRRLPRCARWAVERAVRSCAASGEVGALACTARRRAADARAVVGRPLDPSAPLTRRRVCGQRNRADAPH